MLFFIARVGSSLSLVPARRLAKGTEGATYKALDALHTGGEEGALGEGLEPLVGKLWMPSEELSMSPRDI